jgi:STE24 endopeptidase
MPLSGRSRVPGGLAGTSPWVLIAAALATVAVAEIAVLVLSPGDLGPEPVTVNPTDWFTPEQIERARDFRGGQRNLMLAGLALELLALATLALGRPRPVRRLLERAGARPVLGAAAAGAGISLLLAILALPLGVIAHERAVDVGLSTQDLGSWLFDRVRGAGIGLLIAAAGAAVLVGLQRRLPRFWWLAGSGVVVLYAVVSTWLAPVVLAPVFNDFDELPEGPLRERVLALADEAGVDVGQVLRVDASRRGTSLNAYVDGIGSSKRVVLYDNLIEEAERAELEAVVAHELGHVANDDVRRGILFVVLVAPVGMLTVALAGRSLARRGGTDPGTPAALPAYALALTIVAFALGLAGNQLSRAIERSADAFELELTGDPQALIDLQRRITINNLGDPDPQSPLDGLLRTHPSAVERIGAALAAESRSPRS